MGKKSKIKYLRDRIMINAEKVNVLLDIISSNRIDTVNEASVLASIAQNNINEISKNNEKIGILLKQ